MRLGFNGAKATMAIERQGNVKYKCIGVINDYG